MVFYGCMGRIAWKKSLKLRTIRVINDRFLLMTTQQWNKSVNKSEDDHLEVIDLFNTFNEKEEIEIIYKSAFSLPIPMDSFIFHWFDASIKHRSLQSHRSAVIIANSIRILDGYLELVDEFSDNTLKDPDFSIQQFMRSQGMKRIKLWNVRSNRYETHFSSQWTAATNLLSTHPRPFPNATNASYIVCDGYFHSIMDTWISHGMQECNRRSKVTQSEQSQMENDFEIDFIHCCERFVSDDGRENVRMIAQHVDDKDKNRQLKILVCEEQGDQLKIIEQYQHPWPLYDDPYLRESISDRCIKKWLEYRPRVQFSEMAKSSNEAVSMFVFEEENCAINIIQINKGNFLCCDRLNIKFHQNYKTVNNNNGNVVWFSPPAFMRVCHEDKGRWSHKQHCVIDLFLIGRNDIQSKWIIKHIWTHEANSDVYDCKLCCCGKSLAYVCSNDQNEEMLRIVSTVSRNVLMECEMSDYLFDLIQFRPHHSHDNLCALLRTHLHLWDPSARFRQLFVWEAEDGKSASSQQIHTKYIPNWRSSLRSSFSLCGEYFVSWNREESVWSSYRVRVTRDPLTCELLLVNEHRSPFSDVLTNEQCRVIFDQFSYYPM